MQNNQIAIVQGATLSYHAITDITFPNHAAYASRHGYEIQTFEFQPSDAHWGKIQALQETLADPNILRAFWIDADAIFTNMELALTKHLPDGKIVMSCDIFGPNTGCVWLENCPEVHSLLSVIADRGRQWFDKKGWFDQSAFRLLSFHPPYSQLFTYVEQTRMNSGLQEFYAGWGRPQDGFGQWQPGHFILHLAGVRAHTSTILKKILNKLATDEPLYQGLGQVRKEYAPPNPNSADSESQTTDNKVAEMTSQNHLVAIVHGATSNMKELTDVTFPNHRAYAAKHHYVVREFELERSNVYWEKIRVLQETLADPQVQRVFWIDADAIFTNWNLALTEWLPQGKIVMACDVFGPNAGCLWLENCPEVRRLLQVVATAGEEMFKRTGWREQLALRHFCLFPPYSQLTTYVDPKIMNAYLNYLYQDGRDNFGQWQPGDFILHLPAVPMPFRTKIFKEIPILNSGD